MSRAGAELYCSHQFATREDSWFDSNSLIKDSRLHCSSGSLGSFGHRSFGLREPAMVNGTTTCPVAVYLANSMWPSTVTTGLFWWPMPRRISLGASP